MIRYFIERDEKNKTLTVLIQDETGVYIYFPKRKSVMQRNKLMDVWAKLDDWREPRKISTASREYLEFIRQFERPAYSAQKPTSIKEVDNTLDEFIQKLKEGKIKSED